MDAWDLDEAFRYFEDGKDMRSSKVDIARFEKIRTERDKRMRNEDEWLDALNEAWAKRIDESDALLKFPEDGSDAEEEIDPMD